MLAGALAGGVGWGLLAVEAVGESGDGPLPHRVDGAYLPVAVAVSVFCLVVAAVLPRTRILGAVAVALVVASASGWFIIGVLYVQVAAITAISR